MSSNDNQPLSDDEREELERLRAEQTRRQEAVAAQQQRDELAYEDVTQLLRRQGVAV